MVLREISKTTDASVILPVFSQYARTFLQKSNEYAINTLYHKCTICVSFYYNFGSYTTQSTHHKYFYTTYGIDAQKELDWLIEEGYVKVDSAFDSLKHLSAGFLKDFLKAKGGAGLSKMKRSDLDQAVAANYTEEELGQLFELRGYAILAKGKEVLEAHPEIVDKHPQKSY